jgi:predicted ATPase/DNA-binding CsgD family transcriptional regulator
MPQQRRVLAALRGNLGRQRECATGMASNLPSPLTSFIGRQREIAEVKRLLATTRLLTLTGAGGSGKTRLAYELGAEALQEYPDGVWAVEFAPLSDPHLVPQMTASALGVPEHAGWSLTESLVQYLRGRSVLLLFDNCEHLIPACAALAEALLRGCATLRILATSRERLRLTGELSYLVPSLSLPDPPGLPAPESLMQCEAVRLFVERAAFSQPGFALTHSNASAVVDVCRRLDGMPLAIELAAARVRVLTVDQISARLNSGFRLLTGGDRTVLRRHQTLQAAMDWSYDLLSEQERTLLRRLSVFAGGWTLEAAEAICPGEGIEPADILDLLSSLADKSLVLVEKRNREARYRLLETVRQYARDRVRESGESAAVQHRHLEWYLNLAEQADAELRGAGQEAWLERLEVEHDNLRVALEWSGAQTNRPDAETRLAGALRWFWFIRGYWSEGRRWLDAALARKSETSNSALPRALHGAASLARFQGDYDRARILSEEGLAWSGRLEDGESHAWFLISLGAVALHQGDRPRAVVLFEDGLTRARMLGNTELICTALVDLAVVARLQGDLARSEGLLTESLALSRGAGDKWRTSLSLHSLGVVAFRRDNYRRAAALYAESLVLASQIRDRWIADDCLDGLASVACARGHYTQAARMLGAADALRDTLGYRPLADVQAARDRCVATTRVGLGTAAFAATWTEGRTMALEQVIADALAAAETVSAKATPAPKPTEGKRVGLLTPREREVAALIAQGKTNREIAIILVIAERTADTHVQNILNKLGLGSRAQIAGWAVAHGLHTLTSP